MFFQRYRFRWSLIAAVAAILGAVLLYESFGGIRIETDVLASLPRHDPVLADAHRVIRHIPAQNRLAIDVTVSTGDRDALVAGADFIEAGLRESGLFREVGTGQMEALFPDLVAHVVGYLPLLFDGPQLDAEIAPLLAPAELRRVLAEDLKTLQGLEGIGQADLISRDPLGLRNLALARMSQLLPSRDAQLYRGKILSRDGGHLLVVAELKGASTDAASSRAIPPLVDALAKQLDGMQTGGARFTLTPVGAYRAALDNENAARRDMRTAILLTTVGIALLLLSAFPRPLIGLLALLPSMVGAVFALLVCSFFFPALSILAVSFGGAIMAFTVDLGITYLLFLDRPWEVSGRQAAREVRTGEILAVLTTIGGFLLLLMSKFSVLAEIGVFAALGAGFAYAFVHWVFPRIFPVMPPARKPQSKWLGRLLDGIALAGGKATLAAAALFFTVMLFFACPVFLVDIAAMNSLSDETVAADRTIKRIWGDLTNRIYVMTEGKTIGELQAKSDRLAGMFREDLRRGTLQAAFLLSDLFPGEELARRRAADWRAFWTPARIADLRRELTRSAREMGFAPEAFAPFVALLTGPPPPAAAPVPEELMGFLGIESAQSSIVHVAMVTPGQGYDASVFFARYSAADLASLFDAGLFNRRLGEILISIFSEIAVITGIGIVFVVLLFFLDWRLSLIVLAPVVFALVGTLGTLKLLGRPVDIPGIMLWIVIMGMGIDYGIYYTCAYQRYLDERHPSMGLIRQAMFLAAATTLIGFGVLAMAKHTVLRSIGLTSLLGIAYSVAGAFLIVPPLVKRALVPVELPPERLEAGSPRHSERTLLRYRTIETTPRLFARWKLRLDPMFPRLAAFLENPRRILDIGCGYGVPSVWLLELFPAATVTCIDPDGERVRVAGRAVGARGEARIGRAPDIGGLPDGADTALILDVIHMLGDGELRKTLAILHDKLLPNGRLVVRATIPAGGGSRWMRWIEERRLKRYHISPRYRSREELETMIRAAGFEIVAVEGPTVARSDEFWFIADKRLPGEKSP